MSLLPLWVSFNHSQKWDQDGGWQESRRPLTMTESMATLTYAGRDQMMEFLLGMLT